MRGFFSVAGGSSGGFAGSGLRILPFLSRESEGSAEWASRPISSLKLHGWTTRGEDWEARETRRCLSADDDVGGLKAKTEEEGTPSAWAETIVIELARDGYEASEPATPDATDASLLR